MDIKRCVKCKNYHYLSYAIDSTVTPSVKRFYAHDTIKKYFHLTNETIFDLKLLNQFIADLIFKQTSFRAFCDAYNFQFATSSNNRPLLKSQRLSEIFYAFELIKVEPLTQPKHFVKYVIAK